MTETVLSEDTLFDIVKCIFEKKNCTINDSNLNSFVTNGLSFPKFVCLISNVSEIPGVSNKVSTDKQRKNNNWEALYFLETHSKRCYFQISDINNSNYPIIIEQILTKIYFTELTFDKITSQSIKLFKTIGIDIHKENELYTGLYFIRLFHILTDHQVQLTDKFNDSTDLEKVLSPIFKEYRIPFLLNSKSFELNQLENTFLQYQIIFDRYQEKIESIIKNENDDDENYNKVINNRFNNPFNAYEDLYLYLINIIGKDFNLKVFNFDEIIEEGFIPKFLMRFLNIESIENIMDIESKSIDVQIKNIEAVIQYISKDNQFLPNHLFDFKTQSKRNFSTRHLLRCILNLYFLKTSREEMNLRFYQITTEYTDSIFSDETFFKIPYFIVNGHTNYTKDEFKEIGEYCDKHKIPSIPAYYNQNGDSRFDCIDHMYYQLQLLYDFIDNERKSLHVNEALRGALYKIKEMKIPKFSTICNSIKVKHIIVDNEIKNQEDVEEDEEEEESVDSPIKTNKHPTVFKDRFQKMKKDDQSTNKKSNDQIQIETSEQFWNPEKLFTDVHCEKGILISNEQKDDDSKSLQEWDDNISIIKKIANDETSDNYHNSNNPDKKTKLFKIFKYNEESDKWVYDDEEFQNFCEYIHFKDSKHSKISLMCFLDSNEDDLISINSNFINGKYPKLSDEIFVYALKHSLNNYKRIVFIIHVPKEKENLPNIKTIMTKIYTFLSLICGVRVVVLNKYFYQAQIQNIFGIFNIVDKNIDKLIQNKEESKKFFIKISREYERSDKAIIDEDADFETNYLEEENYETKSVLFYDDSPNEIIYKKSEIIFLINDKSITNYNSEMDDNIKNCKLFTDINSMFGNQVIMHVINTDNYNSYRKLLLHYYKIEEVKKSIVNNLNCIDCISSISKRYISLKQNMNDMSSIIKSMIHERFSFFESKDNLIDSISSLQSEFFCYSPEFDLCYNEEYQIAAKELLIDKTKNLIDRDVLKNQLDQSAKENIEYLNYLFLKNRQIADLTQIEKVKRTHLSFLDEEFYNIIKHLADESYLGFLHENNIDILNEQIEKDKKLIQEMLSPYIKKIDMKNKPKEKKFEDVKQEGTSYIMKETENIREIKITLEMKDDLKTIIEQDF